MAHVSHQSLVTSSSRVLPVAEAARAFIKLREDAARLNTFDRAYGYYAVLTIFSFGGFFLSAYLIYLAQTVGEVIVSGLLFAFFSVQIAGLLHDAGHRAVFKSAKANDIFGHICGLVICMAYAFWRGKHNKHHAHTNQEGEDPDVEMPLLSFTKERFNAKKGIPRLLVRYQAYIYFPMGMLVVFSPRVGSIKYLRKKFSHKMLLETAIFLIGFFLWFVLPFLLFPIGKALLLFFVVNATAGVYMINVFAPNHKGMPYLDKDVKMSFLEQQIITARNIHGHWLTDFVMLGLNYQIEHHLFPHTPRNKLKRLTPFVKKLCKKYKWDYTNVSFLESNRIILSELNAVGKLETS